MDGVRSGLNVAAPQGIADLLRIRAASASAYALAFGLRYSGSPAVYIPWWFWAIWGAVGLAGAAQLLIAYDFRFLAECRKILRRLLKSKRRSLPDSDQLISLPISASTSPARRGCGYWFGSYVCSGAGGSGCADGPRISRSWSAGLGCRPPGGVGAVIAPQFVQRYSPAVTESDDLVHARAGQVHQAVFLHVQVAEQETGDQGVAGRPASR
jgi:hypothetical protein